MSALSDETRAAHAAAVQFFRDNAGFSYNPKTQTEAQGRKATAIQLAHAESIAAKKGFKFLWSIDRTSDSREFANGSRYDLWACVLVDNIGASIGSLCAIDFGRYGSPYTDNHSRVVQAELALEALLK